MSAQNPASSSLPMRRNDFSSPRCPHMVHSELDLATYASIIVGERAFFRNSRFLLDLPEEDFI
jgi:hypothetical protein